MHNDAIRANRLLAPASVRTAVFYGATLDSRSAAALAHRRPFCNVGAVPLRNAGRRSTMLCCRSTRQAAELPGIVSPPRGGHGFARGGPVVGAVDGVGREDHRRNRGRVERMAVGAAELRVAPTAEEAAAAQPRAQGGGPGPAAARVRAHVRAQAAQPSARQEQPALVPPPLRHARPPRLPCTAPAPPPLLSLAPPSALSPSNTHPLCPPPCWKRGLPCSVLVHEASLAVLMCVAFTPSFNAPPLHRSHSRHAHPRPARPTHTALPSTSSALPSPHPSLPLHPSPCPVRQDPDEYRVSLRARLQALVKAEQGEWLIVHVMRAGPNDPAGKQARKVFARIEDHFRRDRCVRLDLSAAEPNYMEVEGKVVECIRASVDARTLHYSEAVRRLLDQRLSPSFNFCAYYTDKESLALMAEMAQLRDDALRDYDEMEQVYLDTVRRADSKVREFGGLDVGDERAALLDAGRKPMKMFAHEETIKQFDFRQYLFARRAALLFAMGRPAVVADRAYAFILDFSKELAARQRELPFCMREVWVLSACTLVTTVCAERFAPRSPGHYTEKDFFRLQGDLISLARSKARPHYSTRSPPRTPRPACTTAPSSPHPLRTLFFHPTPASPMPLPMLHGVSFALFLLLPQSSYAH
ncbi:unnamed protein product [Closterium sp. NIES-53]